MSLRSCLCLFILFVLAVGCASSRAVAPQEEIKKVNYAEGGRVYSEDGYPILSIYTVEHDGCKFVVTRGWNGEGVSTIHHPRCSCGKAAKP